jgi:uncharacterized membrane protein
MQRRGWLIGAGVGAGLMYVLDPRQGRRRRALARDKLVSVLHRADDVIHGKARDLANRTRGVVAETRARVRVQGDSARGGGAQRVRPELRERSLPTTRALAGATGLALVARALARRTVGSSATGLLGAGIAAAAGWNLELKRLLGSGGGRSAIDVHRVVKVAAPVEAVFDFWRRYENFPRFMANAQEVRELGAGRSQWTVAGPAGIPVQWEAELTQVVPNKLIAWKTLPGSTVEHAGIVRFEPNDDGTTTVNVCMSYDPPAGAVGHTVATLFGADPESELEADLARMKRLVESGRAGGHETYVH